VRTGCKLVGATLALSLLARHADTEELFTPNPLVAIYEGENYDLGGMNDSKCEIRLAGTRGGAFSGQADGDYKLDFSVVDRYLDLAEKHLGKPPVVCFYVWDHFCGGGGFGTEGKANSTRIPVTLYDAEKKQAVSFEGPAYQDPDAEKFWKPVADGLMERIKKRGLEKSLMLGMGSDVRPKTAISERLYAAAADVAKALGVR
jgi:hypothetical protein